MKFPGWDKGFTADSWGRLFWAFSILSISAIYVSLPFETFLRQPFWDLSVYQANFESGYPEQRLYLLNDQFDHVASLAEEHLWIAAVVLGREVLGSYDAMFTAVSFFSCVVILAVMIRSTGWPIALMMLAHPWMAGLLMSQIRSALAISLVYAAWRWHDLLVIDPKGEGLLKLPSNESGTEVIGSPSWLWIPRTILLIAACYIHTAMTLMISCILAGYVVHKISQNKTWVAIAFMWGFVALVTFALSAGRQEILGSIADRRAEYEVVPMALSELIIWGPLLVLFAVMPKPYIHRPESVFAVICLSVFLFTAHFGVPASRVFIVSMPFFLGAILCFRGVEKTMALTWVFLTSFLYLRSNYALI
ncbi:MAG: hypothetical protein H0W78_04045 [Planctomycetes bacterium]|nr:hypothetical protein [Planctomycetota bacterium]